MRIRHTLIAAALAAVLGGLIVPALAEAPGGSQTMPDQDMGMGRMGHGMMSGGMMSGGMMSGRMMGGCMGMRQSMKKRGRAAEQPVAEASAYRPVVAELMPSGEGRNGRRAYW
jgi:hypothetical protein